MAFRLLGFTLRGASAIVISLILITAADAEEYCLPEVFHAECASNELIVITRALFGRMELGRCVTRNYGHIGCAVDVLSAVDQACSGRRSCDLSVSDPSLVRTKPCPKDFASYLDADYTCVPVLPVDAKKCQDTGLLLVNETDGYISGSDMLLAKCVIAFKMAPDQRVNLTLFDFTARLSFGGFNGSASFTDSQLNTDGALQCPVQYATVTELPPTAGLGTGSASSTGGTLPARSLGGYSAVVCGGPERRRHVVTSRSNHLQMRVIPSRDARFLIKFEVLGCGDPVLPANTHVHRDRAGLTVICNASRETFRLVCVERKWVGTLHNCSKTVLPRRSDIESSEEYSVLPPFGVSVVIAVGIALVIVVYATLLVVCVMFMRKRHRQQRSLRDQSEQPVDFNPTQTRLYSSHDVTMSMADRHPVVSCPSGAATCRCGQRPTMTVAASKPDVTETDVRQDLDFGGWPFYGLVAGGTGIALGQGHQTLPGRFRRSSTNEDVIEIGLHAEQRRCDRGVVDPSCRTAVPVAGGAGPCGRLSRLPRDDWLNENTGVDNNGG